ncbi:hypothetical protein R6Q59_033481 [Mikania micrantha]
MKKRIEATVRSRELAHLVEDIKEKKFTTDNQQGEKDKNHKEILMVSCGSPENSPCKKETKAWMTRKIKFPQARQGRLEASLVVIKVTIENVDVHRVYLDGISVSEIMYEHCFIQLDEDARKQLKKSYTLLVVEAEHRQSNSRGAAKGMLHVVVWLRLLAKSRAEGLMLWKNIRGERKDIV